MLLGKRFFGLAVCCLLSVLFLFSGCNSSEAAETIDEVSIKGNVKENDADSLVVPDRYNTGCSDDLTVIDLSGGKIKINGVVFKASGTAAIIDYLENSSLDGSYVIENYDFSNYMFKLYRPEKYTRKVQIVFRNCKFRTFSAFVNGDEMNMSFSFENCSFNRFSGSNAEFDHCFLGNSYRDGMVPFQNVSVKNCYFSSFESSDPAGAGLHTDGIQIFGQAGVLVHNIVFENCRFEVPRIKMECGAGINACVMLQLEYSNGEDIHFSNCTLNGGTYSLYAYYVKNATALDNTSFENIRFGSASLYGNVYPTISKNVSFDNIEATNSLYIGSVWKENNEVHLSVTNDTGRDRILYVATDKGTFEYTIPACPDAETIYSTMTNISKLPFDLDTVIPADCQYVICYDITYPGAVSQIRFVNWSGNSVYFNGEVQKKLESLINPTVLSSGKCGTNAEYTLYSDGKLVIYGEGSTKSYSSGNLAPWAEYRDLVNTVVIKSGITTIGSLIFYMHDSLTNVVIEDGVSTILHSAFYKCSMLTKISIPKSITNVGDKAFSATIMQNVYYEGSEDEWNQITIGSSNSKLNGRVIYNSNYEELVESENNQKVIDSGSCGKNVTYTLYRSGVLELTGTGATKSYSSGISAPWAVYRDEITSVVVENGITLLGSQLFYLCTNLENAVIGEGCTTIDSRAFFKCSSLSCVYLPSTLKKVGTYAFSSTSLNEVIYNGSMTMWEAIEIEAGNSRLSNPQVINGTKELAESMASLKSYSFSYTGEMIEPEVIVMDEGTELKEGTDYFVTYLNNIEPGTAVVTVEGNGDYEGEVSINFVIIDVSIAGKCGTNIEFKLSADGVLTLKGTGSTKNYNSGSPAPWYEYRNQINEVVIDKGITCLGEQLFYNCANLEIVTIGEGCEKIGARAFFKCSGLTTVYLPVSVKLVDRYAFGATALQNIIYDGTAEEWNNIQVGEGNVKFVNPFN